jgi:hypothetical protein
MGGGTDGRIMQDKLEKTESSKNDRWGKMVKRKVGRTINRVVYML